MDPSQNLTKTSTLQLRTRPFIVMAPPPTSDGVVQAAPHVHSLLKRLHAASAAQESSISQTWFYITRLLKARLFGATWSAADDGHMLDKFVALEPDKCHFVYLLARSMGARNIVEAGTSFGVSTIYLALAVGQNVSAAKAAREGGDSSVTGKVIATEKEPVKAARARAHWREAGEEVESWIDLREGNLLETLKADEDSTDKVDMLLLDSEYPQKCAAGLILGFTCSLWLVWTPLALPTLKIIQPRLRRGAVVLADNTLWSSLYKDFLDYIHDPANGFKTTTLPFSGGLEMAVYIPEA